MLAFFSILFKVFFFLTYSESLRLLYLRPRRRDKIPEPWTLLVNFLIIPKLLSLPLLVTSTFTAMLSILTYLPFLCKTKPRLRQKHGALSGRGWMENYALIISPFGPHTITIAMNIWPDRVDVTAAVPLKPASESRLRISSSDFAPCMQLFARRVASSFVSFSNSFGAFGMINSTISIA